MSKKYTITQKSKPMGVMCNGGNTELIADGLDEMQVSDGYHTMDELYEHRIVLFIALCRAEMGHMYHRGDGEPILRQIWRTKLHSDGSHFDGWFVLGINKEEGEQITYHLPMSKWGETEFAETLYNAPKFDGHTSADVLERLKNL